MPTLTIPEPVVAPEPTPVAPDSRPRSPGVLSRRQVAALVGTPIVLAVLVWGGASGHYAAVTRAKPSAEAAAAEPDGAKLYFEQCARCHGATGRADGVASAALDPPARSFGEEQFRFATTANGAATDDDLLFVVRNGIPGSAMPKFDQLTDAERQAVLRHVRRLARAGLYQRITRKGEQSGGLDPDVVHELVIKQLSPGAPVEVPTAFPPATPEAVARGQRTYTANCAKCHGPEGRGDGPDVKDLKNEDGRPTHPRDLTKGQYKAGGEPERLYRRIIVGIPGTPMPASTTLKPDEVCDLVHYIRSLAPPGGRP